MPASHDVFYYYYYYYYLCFSRLEKVAKVQGDRGTAKSKQTRIVLDTHLTKNSQFVTVIATINGHTHFTLVVVKALRQNFANFARS